MGIPIVELVQSREGRPDLGGGTWVHPQVAINLAQEVIEAKAAAERQAQAGPAEGRGAKASGCGKFPQAVCGKTRDKVAAALGISLVSPRVTPVTRYRGVTALRAYLEAEMGPNATGLETVAPGDNKGGRPKKGEETCPTVGQVSG
jgi:hypothetical protein